MAVKTWTATNTHTYRGSKWRTQREMYQGDYTGSGQNSGFAWFNTTDIKNTLSGQIIDKVEFYIRRENTEHGSSLPKAPVVMWNHNVTDGGSVSVSAYKNKHTTSSGLLRGEGKWFTVPNAIGEALRDGSSKGIVIYTNSGVIGSDYYIICSAYNSSYPPQIRITYHAANTAPTTPGAFTSPSSGTRYESSVSVAWGASTDVDGDTLTYYLEASINGGSYSQIYKGTSRSYTHNITGVTRGHSIKYRVRAHDGTVYSGYRESSTCYRNKVPNTPSAFSEPTSGTRYESSIPVSWGASTDPDGHSVTYRLEVSINGGTYSQIYSGSSTSYTHSITGVTRGQSIQYRVRAYDGMAYSSYQTSSLCYRNTAPSTPGTFTSPSGTITNRGSVTIAWGHSTDDQTAQASLKYELGLSVDGGTSYTILKEFSTGNSYTYDFANWTTNLNYNASSCYFRVRAQDQHGITSGYRTSSVFAIDFRKPPTLPGTFTGITTKDEKTVMSIGWGASSDPNEDAVTYLLQFWNRSAWVTIGSALTANSFSYTLPAVNAEYSDYKFRVRASDPGGLVSDFRESGTFTIKQRSAPTVRTGVSSTRTMSTVKVSGSIDNLGGYSIIEYGVMWGTSPDSMPNKVNLGTKTTTGSFTATIEGLDGDTAYYARAFATNVVGTNYGTVVTIQKYNPPLYIDTLGVGVRKKRERGALDVAGALWFDELGIHFLPPDTDINDVTKSGFYRNNYDAQVATMLNTPTNRSFSMMVLNHAGVSQIWFDCSDPAMIYHRTHYSGTWGAWKQVSFDGHNHSWGEISGKPSTFPPSAHNQDWSTITGTPSTFAPSAHNHSGADITSGTVPYARLPVGTGSSQVAQGSHSHSTYLPKSDVRTGTFTANSSSGTSVSFSSAMRTTPRIVAQYAKTGSNVSGDRGSLKLYNITSSGFSAYIGGSNDATARDCHYIAITL